MWRMGRDRRRSWDGWRSVTPCWPPTRRVSAGQPQVLLITGAGRHRQDQAGRGTVRPGRVGRWRGAGPARGVGAAGRAALAYGPFVAALREQAGWLLADDRTPDMLAARHRLFVRVLELLAGLAARSPLVLVLEDLHWADDSSRELLAFLAVRLRDQPVMLVGTLREEELAGERPAMARRAGAPAPGDPAAAGRGWPTARSPSWSPACSRPAPPARTGWRRWSAPRTATRCTPGNSLTPAPQARPPRSPMPCWPRPRGSPRRPGRSSTRSASRTAGCPMSCWPRPSRCRRSDLLASARRAVASGLLVPAADGYAFSHALTRQVLYAHLLPGERRHLHHRLAEALAARAGRRSRAAGPALAPGRLTGPGCAGGRAGGAPGGRGTRLPGGRPVLRPGHRAGRLAAGGGSRACWRRRRGPRAGREIPDRAAGWIADALAQSGDAAPADRARLLERLGRYRFDARDLNAARRRRRAGRGAAAGAARPLPCGPGCSPRSPPDACCSATSASALPVAERAVTEARAGWRRGRARPWAGDARHRPGAPRRVRRRDRGTANLIRASRAAPATWRTSSGRRPTTCTSCTRPAASPKRSRWRRRAGPSPSPWTPRRR